MLLLACTTAAVDTAPELEDADEVEPAAQLAAEEVGSQLQALLDVGLPDPLTLRQVFTSLFEFADDDCPGAGGYALPGDYDGCVTESGWTFAGVSTLVEDADTMHLWNDCLIEDGEGHLWTGGGHAIWSRGDGAVGLSIDGTFGFTGYTGWVGAVPSANLTAFGGEREDGWWLVLDGGLSYGDEALWFSELIFDPALCGERGSGAAMWRGVDGWYTVTFTDCSGCGTVTFETGELLDGQACVSVPAADLLGRLL